MLDFVFNEVLGIGYTLLSEEPADTLGPTIYYGSDSNNQSNLKINNISLLEEHYIRNIKEEIQALTNEILLFLDSKEIKNEIPDLFSFIFFCLSRYEEYLPHTKDHLGRFQSKDSMMVKMNLTERALVDECINWLKLQLGLKFKEIKFPKKKFSSLISTIDIDQVWSFAHKGWRNYLGLVKNIFTLDFKNLRNRLSSWNNTSNDPFNTFELIEDIHLDSGIKPQYFILLSEKITTIDKNHKSSNPYFVQLIKDLSKSSELGIHPSSHSHAGIDILQNEKRTLETIIEKEVTDSRQHFLILKFPETYRNLIKIGIHRDFSMGYAETIGYRASAGHQFKWFDLDKNQATDLTIIPFQFMDVSLKNYMKLNPVEAISKIEKLKKYAFTIESPLCAIWHNSSLDEDGDWKGWTDVYRKCIIIENS